MQNIPLPKGFGWEVDFIFWLLLIVITCLLAITVFLIGYYIKKNDDHHTALELSVLKQSATMENSSAMMIELSVSMTKNMAQIQEATTKFQRDINADLLAINQTTSQIKIDLAECNHRVGDVMETVSAHHKSLTLGVKALEKHSSKLEKLENYVRNKTNPSLRQVKS